MNGVNLKSLGLSKTSMENGIDLSSEDGILKEYKRLSIQLKQLQILRKRTIDQIQNLKQEKINITNDTQKFANLQVGFKCITSIYIFITICLEILYLSIGTTNRIGCQIRATFI